MGEFIVYILKSSVCLAMFYLFYRLLLSRETFHRFNRMALLGLVVLSVLIPFYQAVTLKPVAIQEPMLNLEALLQIAQEQTIATAPDVQSVWLQVLLVVYMGGCLFFLIRFVSSAWMIVRLIGKGEKRSLENGITLVVTSQQVGPFSWGKYIVISRKDMASNESEIIAHETAHIKAAHSWDLLILSFCTLLHWFNPAVWLLKRELQNIHEFEADADVLNMGADPREYQLLLIKKSVGSQRFTAVVHSFSHSELKKRIAMMLRQKSNPWSRLKYICVLPLTAVAVLAFARPEVTRELDKIAQVKLDNPILIAQTAQAEELITKEPAQPVQQKKTEKKKKEVVRVTVKDSTTVDTQSKTERQRLQLTVTSTETRADVSESLLDDATKTSLGTQKVPTLGGEDRKWTLDTVPKHTDKGSVKVVNTLRLNQSFKDKDKQPLIIVDGEERTYDVWEKMLPQNIESISILKDESGEKLYGDKAKNGVIIVKTIRKKKY